MSLDTSEPQFHSKDKLSRPSFVFRQSGSVRVAVQSQVEYCPIEEPGIAKDLDCRSARRHLDTVQNLGS